LKCREVPGSIPNQVIFLFGWHYPSGDVLIENSATTQVVLVWVISPVALQPFVPKTFSKIASLPSVVFNDAATINKFVQNGLIPLELTFTGTDVDASDCNPLGHLRSLKLKGN